MNQTDKLLSNLPHIRGLFGDDEVQKVNNRYDVFDNASISKEKRVQRLSVTNKYDYDLENSSAGSRISNLYYQQLMYGSSSDDKKRRIDDYRSMANFSEVERALREICNEFYELDDSGEIMKFKLRGDYNEQIKELIKDEFKSFLEVFKLEEKGRKYIWDWLVEGELFFENIISVKKPELGIIGLTRIAAERCDPLYYDLDNELIDSYVLRAKTPDMYPFQWGKFTAQASYGSNHRNQILFMNEKQITYIANDQWSDGKKYKLPVLSYAHRPYRQLSLIEDATIIYMLVRAPERLVFNIHTGNMNPSKSEQYLRKLASQFWTKKTIANDGRVENVYDPQGMMENYWFPMGADGKGSTVESVGGGDASPDNLEILNFFVQKLYQSLKVPLSRLNSDTAFNDGEAITREELTFAEYIIDLQKLWASAIKRSFIVHLKLRGKKILEVAKKVNVDNVIAKPKNNNPNSFQVSQIFKDEFDHKCWDNYDYLVEAVDDEINRQLEELTINEEMVLNDLIIYENSLEQIENGLITEDATQNKTTILENISILEDRLESIREQKERVEDYKSDATSWWEQYDLREEDLDIKFVEPTQIIALRQQQLLQLKFDNFNTMAQNDMISTTLAMKLYLGWSDKEIFANLDMLRRDAAFRWELAQIEQSGPDFRQKALEELEGAVGGGGGGLGIGGGLGGAGPALPSPGGAGPDTNLPAFGSPLESPETGQEEGGEEGGESAESAGPSAPPNKGA